MWHFLHDNTILQSMGRKELDMTKMAEHACMHYFTYFINIDLLNLHDYTESGSYY